MSRGRFADFRQRLANLIAPRRLPEVSAEAQVIVGQLTMEKYLSLMVAGLNRKPDPEVAALQAELAGIILNTEKAKWTAARFFEKTGGNLQLAVLVLRLARIAPITPEMREAEKKLLQLAGDVIEVSEEAGGDPTRLRKILSRWGPSKKVRFTYI